MTATDPLAGRTRQLASGPAREGRYVLYWMERSQRAEDNPALEESVARANALACPLVVVLALGPGARRGPVERRRVNWALVRRFIGRGANQGFTCAVCGAEVPALANGSYRNHCPVCLHSLHVDVNPGDRASDCGGVLEPVAAEHSGKKGWIIVHRCRRCGAVRRNRAALDDPLWPDDYDRLVALASGRAPPR